MNETEKNTLDKNGREALRRVLAYLARDERRHWEEMGKPENHIYRALCIVADGAGFILDVD